MTKRKLSLYKKLNTVQSYSTILVIFDHSAKTTRHIKKSLFITESIKLSKIANNSFSSCHVCIYRIFILLFVVVIVNMYGTYVWNLCIEYNLPAKLYTYIRKQSPQTIQKKPLYMKNGDQNF